MVNLKQTEDRRVYFTSDWHLGHQQEFVWKVRGYSSYEDHTNSIIDITNSIVNPNDILINLGDFCLNTTVEKFEEYISRFNCQIIWLLWGNHPNPHYKNIYQPLVKKFFNNETYYSPDTEVYPLRYKNIVYRGHSLEVCVDGQFIVLSHYPISVWNEIAHGAWCLCGHSHGNFPLSQTGNLTSKLLDVGWDLHKKPLSLSEIADIMKDKNIPVLDHHQ
jgi:calcineurin-like phosphoesterase family protein